MTTNNIRIFQMVCFCLCWGWLSGLVNAAHHPDPQIRLDLINLFENPPQVQGYPFQEELSAAAKKYQLPLPFVLAVARGESFFDPGAISAKGAIGIMQVMPATAADYGVSEAQLVDPATNIDVGVHLLADLYAKLEDPYLVLAAYYCGCGGVDKEALSSRKDCDEYVQYIHTHLRTILARAGKEPVSQAEGMPIVIATFDNFLDGESFAAFLSGKLSGYNFDLFRKEICLTDHNRYQYQIIASGGPSGTGNSICSEVQRATGFALCQE